MSKYTFASLFQIQAFALSNNMGQYKFYKHIQGEAVIYSTHCF